MAEKKIKKKKMSKRDKYLVLAMFNIMWFAIAVLILNALDHEVSAELVVAWFASWTVELALVAGIKIKGNNGREEE